MNIICGRCNEIVDQSKFENQEIDGEMVIHILINHIYNQHKTICHGCQRTFSKKLQACNRCFCVRYCSQECLQQHWLKHKKWCAIYKRLKKVY